MKIKNFFKKLFPSANDEIVLNCYTYLPYAYEYAQIDFAINYAPPWWKKMPSYSVDTDKATLKSCVAVLDYFKKGIVIPSWFEMDVNVNEKTNDLWYTWIASNPDVATDNSHTPDQIPGFANKDGKNIKITSPWKFTTEEEIYFSWTEPSWHLRDLLSYITVLPAVINFKFQNSTEVNLFVINKDAPEKFTIPALTPLVILHPLTEKKIIIKNHLITKTEWDNMLGAQALVLKRSPSDPTYKRRKKIAVEKGEGTCPFKHNE